MLYIAPIQGHTDAAWRHFHHEVYGGDNQYFTPFIRSERGEFRHHDLKDYTSELNAGIELEPQVIFRDMEELEMLVSGLRDAGARAVNLNMGCPFPLQTGKGRGAGFIANAVEAAKMPEVLGRYPDVDFSVKMRLGYSDPHEWRGVIGTLNDMRLRFVAVHPRVARQQYGGDINEEEFRAVLEASRNPVVYNGEVRTPADVAAVLEKYPAVAGVMVGRGMLARPSLAAELEEGREWSREERIAAMKRFHGLLMRHYQETLCGESQVMSKIKPFWEYAEDEIGRKAWKAIKKATTLPKYRTALALIEG